MVKTKKVTYYDNPQDVRIEIKDENQPCKIIDKKKRKVSTTLNIKSNEYRSSFTVHGLSRALTGHWFEKVFWGLLILLSLGIIIKVVLHLAEKYNRNDVYIKFYSKEYTKSDVPLLTICPTYFSKRQRCKSNDDCLGNVINEILPLVENSTYEWRNDKIYVKVYEEGVKKGYQLRDFIKASYFNCIRLDLRIFDTSSYTSNGFVVRTPYPDDPIEVFVHDADESYPFLQSKPVYIYANESDEMNIEVKQYKRLQAPFASNCRKSSDTMIFPGEYSKLKCIESLRCVNAFKTCGVSNDVCQEFIPKQIRSKYAKNISTEEEKSNSSNCLDAEFAKDYDEECGLPCNEHIYTVITSFTSQCSWLDIYEREIYIDFPLNPYYHVFEEAQLYSFEQLLCECGGLFGLFTGSSAISIIELMVFLGLLLFRKVFNKKKSEK